MWVWGAGSHRTLGLTWCLFRNTGNEVVRFPRIQRLLPGFLRKVRADLADFQCGLDP